MRPTKVNENLSVTALYTSLLNDYESIICELYLNISGSLFCPDVFGILSYAQRNIHIIRTTNRIIPIRMNTLFYFNISEETKFKELDFFLEKEGRLSWYKINVCCKRCSLIQ